MVRFRLSLPERSPSRTMLRAARSLTEPPGLKYSALAKISTPGNSAAILSRRTSGVLPIVARRGSASVRARIGIGETCAIRTFIDSFTPRQDARSHVAGRKGIDRILSLGSLYHRPNPCQER